MPESIRLVFTLSAVGLSISMLIATFEFITLRREFSDGEFSWRILRTSGFSSVKNILFGKRGFTAILIIRLLCALLLVAGAARSDRWICIAALAGALVTGMLIAYRCRFGLEGSDQMTAIVTAGLLVVLVRPNSAVWPALGFGFIAAQSCLSYFVSGAAKLLSPVWRRGRALYAIVNTETYGAPAPASMLRAAPMLSVAACWTVIVFEVTFPLSVIAPVKITMLILFTGALFHVGNALIMGLNAFFWSFVASYPAIWYCRGALRGIFR